MKLHKNIFRVDFRTNLCSLTGPGFNNHSDKAVLYFERTIFSKNCRLVQMYMTTTIKQNKKVIQSFHDSFYAQIGTWITKQESQIVIYDVKHQFLRADSNGSFYILLFNIKVSHKYNSIN